MTADQPPSSHHADTSPPLRLQDPRAIRALAHPARMAIIDALATGRELTATECAELTGLSPSATAYHLKFLERHDFAERAPARKDGRERPWRASARRKHFELDASTPAGSAAATAVALAFFDRTRRVGQAFLAGERDEPEEWQRAAALASSDLWLTADEAQKLNTAFAALLEPYRDRDTIRRPDGSRRVRIANITVPHADGDAT